MATALPTVSRNNVTDPTVIVISTGPTPQRRRHRPSVATASPGDGHRHPHRPDAVATATASPAQRSSSLLVRRHYGVLTNRQPFTAMVIDPMVHATVGIRPTAPQTRHGFPRSHGPPSRHHCWSMVNERLVPADRHRAVVRLLAALAQPSTDLPLTHLHIATGPPIRRTHHLRCTHSRTAAGPAATLLSAVSARSTPRCTHSKRSRRETTEPYPCGFPDARTPCMAGGPP
jgi:hypothetical protein